MGAYRERSKSEMTTTRQSHLTVLQAKKNACHPSMYGTYSADGWR
jgi:hypothetical protein